LDDLSDVTLATPTAGEVLKYDGTNWVLGVRPDTDSSAAERLVIPIVSLGPASAFIVAVKVAAYAGVILAAPFILYFVAAFVFPALKMKERKPKPLRLILVCDVSGSMDLYSQFFLRFMHGLQNHYPQCETFAFSTRLSHITSL
jgi:hypothetical protein